MPVYAGHTKKDQPKTSQKARIESYPKPTLSCAGRNRTLGSILDLQRTCGNRTVQRLLQSSNSAKRFSALGPSHPVTPVSGGPRLQRGFNPWPLNGRVINNSSRAVTVWSDTDGIYTIAAGSESARFTEDVDHIQDQYGQWYKIGPNTVTVDANGEISGYQCEVDGPGKGCGRMGDFPTPEGPTSVA